MVGLKSAEAEPLGGPGGRRCGLTGAQRTWTGMNARFPVQGGKDCSRCVDSPSVIRLPASLGGGGGLSPHRLPGSVIALS